MSVVPKKDDDDDKILLVQGQKIPCNQAKLCEISPFFDVLFQGEFKESRQNVVELVDHDPDVIRSIVMYSKLDDDFEITPDNLLALVVSSNMLGIDGLMACCNDYIKDLYGPEIMLSVFLCTKFNNDITMRKHALRYIQWHFKDCMASATLVRLLFEDLLIFLQSDELRIKDEAEVFQVAFRWLQYKDPGEVDPQQMRELLLNTCRFNHVGEDFKLNILEHPVLNPYPDIRDALGRNVFSRRSPQYYPCVIARYSETIYQPDGRCFPLWILAFDLKRKTLVPYKPVHDNIDGYSGFRAVANGKDLYFVGGEKTIGSGRWNQDVYKYDPITEEWTVPMSFDAQTRHHGICCDAKDERIYMVGGHGRHRLYSAATTVIDVQTKSLLLGPEFPIMGAQAATCLLGDYVYVFKENIFRLKFEDGGIWQTVSNIRLPANENFTHAVSDGEAIYVAGISSPYLYKFVDKDVITEPVEGDRAVRDMERIGRFKFVVTNMCLVDRTIYNIAKQQFSDESAVESYNLNSGEFKMLWQRRSRKFFINPECSMGCFSMAIFGDLDTS